MQFHFRLLCAGLVTALCIIPGITTLAQEEDPDQVLQELLQELEGTEGEMAEQEAQMPTGEHDAAEDILDDLESDKWSYDGEEKIELVSAGQTDVTIKVTQVLYEDQPVEEYKIYYSNSTLATQDFDKIQDQVVEVDMVDEDEDNLVHLTLDGLTAGTTYYLVVSPVHPTDPTIEPLTMISNELSVTTESAGGVAADDKVFESVTYTQDGNSVEVTRQVTNKAETAEVNVRHQSEGSYQVVGTPAMDAGSFTFTVAKSGNYFLKMRALDAQGNLIGKEHIQTVKVDGVQAPAQPVQTAPQVGPTTDLIIGLMIFAAIIYLVYRFRRIEN